MISVLIPSYNNPDGLTDCVSSLLYNCHSIKNIEILVRLDKNDPQFKEYSGSLGTISMIHSDLGSGYEKLHLFVNELASHSTGDWLLLMTDDSIMKTKSWDVVINYYNDRDICVLNPCGDGLNLFPIVKRKLYNILGHLALQPHYDTYIQDLSGLLKCYIRLYNLDIEHTGKINDHSETSKHYYSKEIQDLLKQDAQKIEDYLTKNGK